MDTYSIKDKLAEMRDEAYAKGAERGISPQGGHNGSADAFRHVYTSAKVTRDYGSAVARTLGTANEIQHPNPSNERYMDESNNAVGREIGQKASAGNWSDDQIADDVKKAMDEGRVILSPEDVTKEQEQQNPYIIPEYQTFETSKQKAQASIADYYNKPTQTKKLSAQQSTSGGNVFVHAYDRKNGRVYEHYRSRPDGFVTNNLGSRTKK
ncbi:MAG: hypothetical protein COY40_03855 [Alphaproteobacteria bacterium CG_4_10_14_0_8_um_filter_53_9]|nr:MAG: hypothetical protein COY40_03855 [Alphaproteobacteria bacterium CG_4_10_14_0_8_um_filter_53_9]